MRKDAYIKFPHQCSTRNGFSLLVSLFDRNQQLHHDWAGAGHCEQVSERKINPCLAPLFASQCSHRPPEPSVQIRCSDNDNETIRGALGWFLEHLCKN